MYRAIETNFAVAAVIRRFILSIDHSLTTTNWINVIYHENEQFSQRGLVYSTLRRNSFKLAKKPQNLSQDENVIFLVVIRGKNWLSFCHHRLTCDQAICVFLFVWETKKKSAVSQVNHRQTRRIVCQIPVIIKHQALWVRERESELDSGVD